MSLKGVTVLEFSGIGPAPLLGLMLADFGATVISVDKLSGGFAINSRGKKSLAMDLKKPESIQAIHKLIPKVDVLIDPYRPGVMEKLGLGPTVLMGINPRLIFARLTGWGQTGPWAPMAGHDTNYVAITGALSALGRENEIPAPPGNYLADFAGGTLTCAWGIVMCLYEREKSGKGQVIDCAMQDGLLYLTTFLWESKGTEMWNQPRGKNILDGGAPFYEVYQTKDGKYLSVGAIEPQFFAILIDKLALSDKIRVSEQYNKKKWPEHKQIFTEQIKTKTRDEWNAILANTDACAIGVTELHEIADHPHLKARQSLITTPGNTSTSDILKTHAPRPAPRLSRTPGRDVLVPQPLPGEHSVQVMKDFGISETEIQNLLSKKAIRSTNPRL